MISIRDISREEAIITIITKWKMLKVEILLYLRERGDFTPEGLSRILHTDQERILKALRGLVSDRKVFMYNNGYYGARKADLLIQPLEHNPSK